MGEFLIFLGTAIPIILVGFLAIGAGVVGFVVAASSLKKILEEERNDEF